MAAPSVVPITKAKLTALDKRREAALESQRQGEYKASIDDRAAVLDSLDRDVFGIDEEMRLLRERKQRKLSEIETLENTLLEEMHSLKAQKLVGNERTLLMRANPPRLIIEDETAIPKDYLREKVLIEPDKNSIKAALSLGEEIAGVKLVQTMSLLRK
jgi:hypothetical protein